MKTLFPLFVFLFFICQNIFSQQLDKNKEYHASVIAFYNLENLFDTITDPDSTKILQDEFTPNGNKKWNSEKYFKKLENLSEVISQLGTEFNPDGPAILGVSEIENRSVLEDLVKTEKLKSKNYQIVHYEGPDKRGIDVALFYNPNYFKVTSSASLTLKLPDDSSFFTRDQLLVSGELQGEPIHLMVAHWPSRRGGQKASDHKRIAAAQLGRKIVDSLLTADPNAKILYMGDLNDDPTNNSVKKNLLATGKKSETSQQPAASNQKLFNPMWNLYQKGIGTLAWRDVWNLFDQIVLSPALIEEDFTDYSYYGAKVFNKEFLKQSEGNYAGYPYRSFVGSNWIGGYSDHFPVYVVLIREK
ncbi:MAG: endonuclease [Flavobacteriales bacterium]|nr:MAG: endonuclease [Flavobacteriales bacterium]